MSKVVLKLKRSEIIRDPRLQMRAGPMDQAIIDEYAEDIFDLPAIDVIKGPNGELWLVDGNYRDAAHEKMGLEEIRANIEDGTWIDAMNAAAGANAKHGRKRTDADKRRAVKSLLLEPLYLDRSDRMIAKACKVSHTFVAKIRERLDDDAVTEFNGKKRTKKTKAPKTRTGMDGKTRPAKGSNGRVQLRCERCTRVCPPGDSIKGCVQCIEANKRTPPAATAAPASSIKDDMGRDVPAHLSQIFAIAPLYKEAALHLKRAKDLAKTIEASPASRKNLLVKSHFTKLSIVLERLKEQFEALRPAIAVHGLCDGNGCDTCQKDGWQSHEEYQRDKKRM